MKPIKMFMQRTCPYCRQAMQWMEACREEHPEYDAISVEMIDEREQPDVADEYDYYYVPTFYIDEVKVHEGAATRAIVDGVFARAYKA